MLFPVTIGTNHVFTQFIVIAIEEHIICNGFVKENIGIPTAHIRNGLHRLTVRTAIQAEHRDGTHPVFKVRRNHHKKILSIRRIGTRNGLTRSSWIFIHIKNFIS